MEVRIEVIMNTDKEKLVEFEKFHWFRQEYQYNDLPEKTKAEIQEICQPSCESFKIIKEGSFAPLLLISLTIVLFFVLYMRYLNGIRIPDNT